MAGLFDNELFRFLVTPRAYFAQQDQARDAQKFQGLLGGLGGGSPNEQFWLQAAQLPSYQGLAGQQLGYGAQQGGAMARQQQQQSFELNNLTAAQQEQLALQQMRADRDYAISQQDLQRKWFGTQASAASSYASADASRASQALSGTRGQLAERQLEKANLELQRERGSLLERLPPANQLEARQDLLTQDTWAQSASDVADWITNRGAGAALPGIGTKEGAAMNAEWQTSVKPAIAQMQNLGVIQPGEAEAVEAIMGRPDDYVLTKSDVNLMNTIAQKVRDLRSNKYQAAGVKPAELKKGQSAAARTLSGGKPRGQLRPVTSLPAPAPEGTIWNPVQRY